MEKLRKFGYFSLIPMILVLPLWITVGRGFFYAPGWMMLQDLFFHVPILLVSMIILCVLIRSRRDVKSTKLVSPIDAWLLALFYGAVFLYGFFEVDGGDTQESVNSVAMLIFGRGFEAGSELIQLAAYYLGIATLAGLFVVAITEFIRWRKLT